MNVIELDGSTGEGGGQILRTALALSICTGQAIAIQRIRAKRPKPGLMRQHLTCVQAAASVCTAKVEGAELGSQTLVFEPGEVRTVNLVALGGRRIVRGLNGLISGALDDPETRNAALERARAGGYAD